MSSYYGSNDSETLDSSNWEDEWSYFSMRDGNDKVITQEKYVSYYFRGGSGSDTFFGFWGKDQVHGEGQSDRLHGNKGRDDIYGGSGNDYLYGDDDNDEMDGGIGNDHLYGGRDEDLLRGGNGKDYLYGGSGDDKLSGEGGNDYLNGGPGMDYLVAKGGKVTLVGGGGTDEFFVYNSRSTASSAGTIDDWNGSQDELVITAIRSTRDRYGEDSTTALSIDSARNMAENSMLKSKIYVFLYNSETDIGYILCNADANDSFEKGVILAGSGFAGAVSYGDIGI